MIRILITGANRGLGLEFVKQYLNRGEEVIATFRQQNDTTELEKLKNKFNNSLTLIPMDVTLNDSRKNTFSIIKSEFSHLDILINNAGMKGKNYYPTHREKLSSANM